MLNFSFIYSSWILFPLSQDNDEFEPSVQAAVNVLVVFFEENYSPKNNVKCFLKDNSYSFPLDKEQKQVMVVSKEQSAK